MVWREKGKLLPKNQKKGVKGEGPRKVIRVTSGKTRTSLIGMKEFETL